MRRPVAVLVPLLVLLLASGLPFLRLDLTPGGPDVLPADSPARIASERLLTDFPAGEADPIPVLVRLDSGNVLSSSGVATLESFIARAQTIPHVTRVESIVTDPSASELDWSAIASGTAAFPESAQPLVAGMVRGDTTLVQVVADVDGAELEAIVRDLRAIGTPGATVQVGGAAATSVDTVDGIKAGLPAAILFVIGATYLILLLTFGSVFLPLKAIAMTLLSISASLGTLVLVFQDGRLQDLLGFTATGEIISTTPILMFSILFGLSMDYEVLMLTRIQEEYQRTGDNRASVAFGLKRTARTITSAAAIMVVAFGAFMLADIVIIKSLGFGLTLAVLIDATIVRGLLVPATMRLMGDWNWWAPHPIKAIVDRIGFSHAERPGPSPVAGD
jgi:RND superfamily putative drug exporter